MTDDLVKRLREHNVFNYADYDAAADRIEQLEAALRKIVVWDVTYYWNDAGPLASHMQSVARAALAGEKKDE